MERQKEFAEFSQLNIFAATWNLAGISPPLELDLSKLFNFQGNATPDVIIVGLQEFVELNAANVMGNQGDGRINAWRDLILNNLGQLGNFIYVRHQSLVGILLLIFAKQEITPRISRVDADVVKTGLGGNFGNKGGAIIRMFIDDSSFCFINCHLESGNKANNVRLSNIIDIHQKAFQQEGIGKRRVSNL